MAISTPRGNPHEGRLAQWLFDFMLSEELPECVMGDMASDRGGLADELAQDDIELIAPNRSNRMSENKTQDGRQLCRYERRGFVAPRARWLHRYCRLCTRSEKTTVMFQGTLHLGCTMLLLKQGLR